MTSMHTKLPAVTAVFEDHMLPLKLAVQSLAQDPGPSPASVLKHQRYIRSIVTIGYCMPCGAIMILVRMLPANISAFIAAILRVYLQCMSPLTYYGILCGSVCHWGNPTVSCLPARLSCGLPFFKLSKFA